MSFQNTGDSFFYYLIGVVDKFLHGCFLSFRVQLFEKYIFNMRGFYRLSREITIGSYKFFSPQYRLTGLKPISSALPIASMTSPFLFAAAGFSRSRMTSSITNGPFLK
jgi:hypothetical protein